MSTMSTDDRSTDPPQTAASGPRPASAGPPRTTGPLARREARLAWGLLLPTVVIVSLVVVLPLLAIFWISFKPVGLADLRPPAVVVREDLRGRPEAPGDAAEIRYRLRNSSQDVEIRGVTLDRYAAPTGLVVQDLDQRCTLGERALSCDLGDWQGGFARGFPDPGDRRAGISRRGRRGNERTGGDGAGRQYPDQLRVHAGELRADLRRR